MIKLAKVFLWAVAMFSTALFLAKVVGINIHASPIFALAVWLVLYMSGFIATICGLSIAGVFVYRKLKE